MLMKAYALPGRSSSLAFFLIALTVLIAGCQVPPKAPEAEALPPLPPLPVATAERFRVVPSESEATIRVYRAGPLAEYGHNHLIVAGNIQGDIYLAQSFTDSGFELTVPVSSLVVDPPAKRREAGEDFAKALSEQAVTATRDNMLGPRVLDAEQYPEILLRSRSVTGQPSAARVMVRVTIRGVSRDREMTVELTENNGRLVGVGGFTLRQTDFGITPFSVMGGGLRVADELRIRLRIIAERA